jgi:hypothetical protein
MLYIDLDHFLNDIGRNMICEMSIYRYKNKIFIDVLHYHNKPYIDKYMVKTDKMIPIGENTRLTISSLYGMTILTRLKIADLRNLDELPFFGDSRQLDKLLVYNNGLIRLPICIPMTVNYLDCSNNKLRQLLCILPNQLKYLYVGRNQLTFLPEIPLTLTLLSCEDNPLNEYIGKRLDRRRISIIERFRWNYYLLKFGRRFLYVLLKRRMNKHNYKQKLLEMSARIIMNPKRIERLLEIYDEIDLL